MEDRFNPGLKPCLHTDASVHALRAGPGLAPPAAPGRSPPPVGSEQRNRPPLPVRGSPSCLRPGPEGPTRAPSRSRARAEQNQHSAARPPQPARAGASLGRSPAREAGRRGFPSSRSSIGRRTPPSPPIGPSWLSARPPAARRLAALPPPLLLRLLRLADGGANVRRGLFPGRGARAASTWGTARSQRGRGRGGHAAFPLSAGAGRGARARDGRAVVWGCGVLGGGGRKETAMEGRGGYGAIGAVVVFGSEAGWVAGGALAAIHSGSLGCRLTHVHLTASRGAASKTGSPAKRFGAEVPPSPSAIRAYRPRAERGRSSSGSYERRSGGA